MTLTDLFPLPQALAIKAAALGGGVLVVSAAIGGVWLAGRHSGVQHEKPLVAAAQAAQHQAEAQTSVTTQASAAVDHAQAQELTIHLKSEEAARAVQAAPGASAPVPDAVLRQWADGIDGLRAPASDAGAAAAPGVAGPPGAVPSP